MADNQLLLDLPGLEFEAARSEEAPEEAPISLWQTPEHPLLPIFEPAA